MRAAVLLLWASCLYMLARSVLCLLLTASPWRRLAVLAVLSVTTARAELSVTERQAATTTETYQLEVRGQEFLAAVDGLAGKAGA